MHIEPAQPQDLPHVLQIIALCTADMQQQGIDQWDDVYPNRELVEADLCAGTLFVAREDRMHVGAITLDEMQPPQFQGLPWRCTTGRALLVHRLCVRPDCQGRGIARRLMDFAETFAADHGHTCIRLDAYPANPRAISLYERRGYQRMGQVIFPRRKFAFECFEKVIG
jgi:ribosomal protein S18 acetylase RimI-like enzyme